MALYLGGGLYFLSQFQRKIFGWLHRRNALPPPLYMWSNDARAHTAHPRTHRCTHAPPCARAHTHHAHNGTPREYSFLLVVFFAFVKAWALNALNALRIFFQKSAVAGLCAQCNALIFHSATIYIAKKTLEFTTSNCLGMNAISTFSKESNWKMVKNGPILTKTGRHLEKGDFWHTWTIAQPAKTSKFFGLFYFDPIQVLFESQFGP